MQNLNEKLKKEVDTIYKNCQIVWLKQMVPLLLEMGKRSKTKKASLGKPGTHESATIPKKILFIQNLPHETTSMMLPALFQQYPGFREVRMIEAKPGIAFVEFEDDVQSSVAMQALQGFKITPQNPMAVTYAKK
ncbi:hypothetical protein CsSME_00016134 [Camellia sinensis var. sinensis]